jgi:hypothetical protein
VIWQSERDLKEAKALSLVTLSGARLLEDFVALIDRTDDVLLRFARKYGPLGLCKHGFALGHRNRFDKRCYESGCGIEDLNRGIIGREPIAGWHRYLRGACGVLAVAQKLNLKQKATEQDWLWLFDDIPKNTSKTSLDDLLGVPKGYRLHVFGAEDPRPYAAILNAREGDILAANPLLAVLAAHRRRTLSQQRQAMAAVLNHWLDECATGVSLTWPESGLDVSLGASDPLGRGHRLLVAIGVQLLDAVLNQHVYVPCDVCKRPYKPARLPRDGERHYCDDEKCRRTANSEYQRRLRLRRCKIPRDPKEVK